MLNFGEALSGASRRLAICAAGTLGSVGAASAGSAETPAVERVAGLFAERLAVAGGHVWAWSSDLEIRRGEGGRVASGVIWNQPPGTPAVGGAFLALHEITGDERWLRSAEASGEALLLGQLVSGGWFNFTHTDAGERAAWCYRSDGVDRADCAAIDGNERRNEGLLDDNITQSALGFLLWLEARSNALRPRLREAVNYGLGEIIASQHPNGAWSPFLDRDVDRALFVAAAQARRPGSWSRRWVKPEDPPYFVLNDHLMRNTIRLLLSAEAARDDPRLLAAARRAGEFLVAAQLPAPQRAWAQSYDSEMTPVWGRPFEPPAAASAETAGAIDSLARLYLRTGNARYLQSALDAAAWLRDVRLPDGDWARFYELGTDRPLFVRADGALTHAPEGLREGYAQRGGFGVERALRFVEAVARGDRPEAEGAFDWIFEPRPERLAAAALELVVDEADDMGRVIEDGWIRSQTFVDATLALKQAGAR